VVFVPGTIHIYSFRSLSPFACPPSIPQIEGRNHKPFPYFRRSKQELLDMDKIFKTSLTFPPYLSQIEDQNKILAAKRSNKERR